MTTAVDGLLKFTKAEYKLEGDILIIYLPKNFAMFKKRIKDNKKELLEKFDARKLRIDVKKKDEVILDLNVIEVDILSEITDQLLELVNSNEFMAVDFETDSVDAMTTNIISLGLTFINNKETFYIPITHTDGTNVHLEVVMEFLKYAMDKVKFVVHNLSFEKKILDRYDIFPEYVDTMILTYLKGGLHLHGLKHVAKERLGVRMKTFEEIVGKGKDQKRFQDVDVGEAAQYCGSDTLYTAKLLDILYDQIDDDLITLDHNTALACSNMEAAGVLIDPEYLDKLSALYSRRLERIEKVMFRYAGKEFNINSSTQLRAIIYDDMGIEPLVGKKGLTEKGALSTKAAVIEKLFETNSDNKLFKYLCQYRSTSVYLKSFSAKMPTLTDKLNILRASFLYTGTTTGRLASSGPNLQNMPGSGIGALIRGGIIAPEGYCIVAADYSQIEYRLLAHLMSDTNLIDTIKQGYDVHTATAAMMFGIKPEDVTDNQRKAGKTLNFGLVYGRGDQAVAADLNVTLKKAKEFKVLYFKMLSGFVPLQEGVWQDTREKGYSETMIGRRRYLPNINHNKPGMRAQAERQAFNAVIQGSAADLIRYSMVAVQPMCKEYGATLVLQVHDELVFYVPIEKKDEFILSLKGVMEVDKLGIIQLDVPIEVDIGYGKNYLEAK